MDLNLATSLGIEFYTIDGDNPSAMCDNIKSFLETGNYYILDISWTVYYDAGKDAGAYTAFVFYKPLYI
jgi:hypothetical protein